MESLIEVRRAKFEQAYAEKYPGMPLGWNDNIGAYVYAHANGAWFGYQAALGSVVVELPADCHLSRDGLDECHAAGDIRDQMIDAIHAAGVRTK